MDSGKPIYFYFDNNISTIDKNTNPKYEEDYWKLLNYCQNNPELVSYYRMFRYGDIEFINAKNFKGPIKEVKYISMKSTNISNKKVENAIILVLISICILIFIISFINLFSVNYKLYPEDIVIR